MPDYFDCLLWRKSPEAFSKLITSRRLPRHTLVSHLQGAPSYCQKCLFSTMPGEKKGRNSLETCCLPLDVPLCSRRYMRYMLPAFSWESSSLSAWSRTASTHQAHVPPLYPYPLFKQLNEEMHMNKPSKRRVTMWQNTVLLPLSKLKNRTGTPWWERVCGFFYNRVYFLFNFFFQFITYANMIQWHQYKLKNKSLKTKKIKRGHVLHLCSLTSRHRGQCSL